MGLCAVSYTHLLSACDSSAQEDFDKLCFSLTLGNAILFVDGLNKAIVIDCKNWSLRSVQEPDNERVLQGCLLYTSRCV